MSVQSLPEIVPASDPCVIEAIRGFLDMAFENRISYISLEAVVEGQKRSFSITTKP